MLETNLMARQRPVFYRHLTARIARCTAAAIIALSCSMATASAENRDEIILFVNDALGTAIAAYSESGEVCWSETYTPYGDKTVNDDVVNEVGCGIVGEERGFTGHTKDVNSDLVYMQQRYYDPSIGRFLSIDPLDANPNDPRTYNRYAYANNNPYKYIDPDGRQSIPGFVHPGSYALYAPIDSAAYAELMISQSKDALNFMSTNTGYASAAATVFSPPLALGLGLFSTGFGAAEGALSEKPVTGVLVSLGTSVSIGKGTAVAANQLHRLAPTKRGFGPRLDGVLAGLGVYVSGDVSDVAHTIVNKTSGFRGNSSSNANSGSGGTLSTGPSGFSHRDTGTQCTW